MSALAPLDDEGCDYGVSYWDPVMVDLNAAKMPKFIGRNPNFFFDWYDGKFPTEYYCRIMTPPDGRLDAVHKSKKKSEFVSRSCMITDLLCYSREMQKF